jgi:predicted homoserine dehydrogenase-like protein
MQQATPVSTPVSRSNTTLARLQERASAGRPIRVAVVGAGDYGESLVCQLATIPGMVPSVICDLNVEKGMAAFEMAGLSAPEISTADRQSDLDDRVASGKPAITQDRELAVRSPVDVVVDCTGEPEVGARLASSAIDQGKHVVMVNVEADITVGLELAQMADRVGVTYTLADGDQPSLVVELVDWARSLGFEVVSAGKSTSVRPWEVARESLAYRDVLTKSNVTYADVTKTQIEMASAANACGLTIDIEGMHGPSLPIDQMPGMLRPDSDGGLLSRSGVIDYVNDLKPSGERVSNAFKGMFVVGKTAPERSRQVMASKGVIMSPDRLHTLLYRPYHLVGVETPWSIQRAVLDNVPTAAPYVRNVEVVAVSKRELREGEVLVGIGTDEIRGVAVTAEEAEKGKLIPAGMMEGCKLRRTVRVDEKLRFSDIDGPEDSVVWRLRGTH